MIRHKHITRAPKPEPTAEELREKWEALKASNPDQYEDLFDVEEVMKTGWTKVHAMVALSSLLDYPYPLDVHNEAVNELMIVSGAGGQYTDSSGIRRYNPRKNPDVVARNRDRGREVPA